MGVKKNKVSFDCQLSLLLFHRKPLVMYCYIYSNLTGTYRLAVFSEYLSISLPSAPTDLFSHMWFLCLQGKHECLSSSQ